MTYLIRGIDKDITFRFFAVDTTQVVEKAREYHQSSPVATAALGRLLTAGLMVGATLKNQEDKVTLRVNGGGPLGTLIVTANNEGHVKGYVANPKAEVPIRSDGKLDVGSVVGQDGMLQMIKDMGLKEPYSGSSPLVSGEIGDDLASYYFFSEQQPTVVGVGVLVDKDRTVKSAGGFMLQLMPNLNDDEIKKIEGTIGQIEGISNYFEKEEDIETIVKQLLPDFELTITEKTPVAYKCDCSRKRMEEVLISLGEQELEEILKMENKAEISCHFCNKKYLFGENELRSMLDDIRRQGDCHHCHH